MLGTFRHRALLAIVLPLVALTALLSTAVAEDPQEDEEEQALTAETVSAWLLNEATPQERWQVLATLLQMLTAADGSLHWSLEQPKSEETESKQTESEQTQPEDPGSSPPTTTPSATVSGTGESSEFFSLADGVYRTSASYSATDYCSLYVSSLVAGSRAGITNGSGVLRVGNGYSNDIPGGQMYTEHSGCDDGDWSISFTLVDLEAARSLPPVAERAVVTGSGESAEFFSLAEGVYQTSASYSATDYCSLYVSSLATGSRASITSGSGVLRVGTGYSNDVPGGQIYTEHSGCDDGDWSISFTPVDLEAARSLPPVAERAVVTGSGESAEFFSLAEGADFSLLHRVGLLFPLRQFARQR